MTCGPGSPTSCSRPGDRGRLDAGHALGYVRNLLRSWAHGFGWRAQERRLTVVRSPARWIFQEQVIEPLVAESPVYRSTGWNVDLVEGSAVTEPVIRPTRRPNHHQRHDRMDAIRSELARCPGAFDPARTAIAASGESEDRVGLRRTD